MALVYVPTTPEEDIMFFVCAAILLLLAGLLVYLEPLDLGRDPEASELIDPLDDTHKLIR